MLTPSSAQARRQGPVCVITTETNTTADRLVLALDALGTRVIRFDLADFPRRVVLDAVYRDGRISSTLTARGRTADLDTIRSILWWHPGTPQITDPRLTPEQHRWVTAEAVTGLAGTLAALDCLHVNHPVRTRAAQLKPDVLARAAGCGLAVPDTWIGNSPRGAFRFAAAAPEGVVCKSLTTPTITGPDGAPDPRHGIFFTQRVEATALDSRVSAGAHQLQHRIEKDHEIRAVVVGDELFAARIDAHSPAAREDFRADITSLTYERTTVPGDVHTGILRLMAHYALHYAALDLVVDREGQYWLVDLNPAGQYDWLQKDPPGLAVTDALAHFLTNGAPGPGRGGT
ncbi:MvdC/MvdD family ATP grasp protein [Streptomyces yaizuensis]|uniref:RimK domain-containing protein n=1 Tax=Streptomyces yaizuensis TaxID=2989713 RepID=A0AA86MCQ1_9ACTN|nr:ATP-grasp ribosomal peptide maturase [Streptomyces sp. YSPA8]BDT39562.1 RimK domain-containing protein [Streptomyces sp. YSPA8]